MTLTKNIFRFVFIYDCLNYAFLPRSGTNQVKDFNYLKGRTIKIALLENEYDK